NRSELPVYFNQAPVLNVVPGPGAGANAGRGGAPQPPNAGLGQIITPNAAPLRVSPFEPEQATEPAPGERPSASAVSRVREETRNGETERGPRETRADVRPRVVMEFPADAADLLLSGTLANGQFLTRRAAVIDQRLGSGHVVMFAIR